MKSKFVMLLVLLLLTQIFFINLQSVNIPLPSRFSEIVINSFLPQGITVKIKKPTVKGFKKISVEECSLKSKDLEIARINELTFVLSPTSNFEKSVTSINEIHFKKAVFLNDGSEPNLLCLSQTHLRPSFHCDKLSLTSSLKIGSISANIKMNICDLGSLLPFEIRTGEKINSDGLYSYLQKLRTDLNKVLKNSPNTSLTVSGSVEKSKGELILAQDKQQNSSWLSGYTGKFFWNKPTSSNPLSNLNFTTVANEINLRDWGYQISIQKPSWSGSLAIDQNISSIKSIFSHFKYQNISFLGKVEGEVPASSFYFEKSGSESLLSIFSDSNGSKICLLCDWKTPSDWNLQGFIKICPEQNNLHAKLAQGTLKFVKGEKFRIDFWPNPTAMVSKSPVQFLCLAKSLSALQSPPGSYRIAGEISSDLSIYVNQAIGKLGKSEVFGTYFQKWRPAEYRFLVEGLCHPPDISNWLGSWWNPIWQDFEFDGPTPHGDISISGIWGGDPGNCKLFGNVITDRITFRDFKIDSSSIDILLNEKSLLLSSNSLRHSTGQLNGKLVFPSRMYSPQVLLKFNLKGDYPVNDAKNLLGQKVNNALSDCNISLIYCDASGVVFKKAPIDVEDINQTWFDAFMSSNQQFSFGGLKIDSAEGRLSLRKGLLHGDFTKFNVAQGRGSLSFSQLSHQSDQISLDLELENMNQAILSNSTIKRTDKFGKSPEKKSSESSPSDSKVDFSLLADGSFSDYTQFVGTGLINFRDVEVGNVNFLGGIKSKLGKFNLPLPSDALYFDQLKVPYVLDHENIRFDNAKLSGPLSVLLAKGELNWPTGIIDLIAELQIVGNLNIPLIKQIVNFADPLSKISKIKIIGPWENPDWTVHLGTNPLNK